MAPRVRTLALKLSTSRLCVGCCWIQFENAGNPVALSIEISLSYKDSRKLAWRLYSAMCRNDYGIYKTQSDYMVSLVLPLIPCGPMLSRLHIWRYKNCSREWAQRLIWSSATRHLYMTSHNKRSQWKLQTPWIQNEIISNCSRVNIVIVTSQFLCSASLLNWNRKSFRSPNPAANGKNPDKKPRRYRRVSVPWPATHLGFSK